MAKLWVQLLENARTNKIPLIHLHETVCQSHEYECKFLDYVRNN